MRKAVACLTLVATQLIAEGSALAAGAIETRAIEFAKGATSATVKGSIQGDQTIDYTLRAWAGQTLTASLKSSHRANYFNVLPPGSQGEAIFIGSTSGNEWRGTLEADGTYTLRVYLMRSAARRNERADFTLGVGIAGGERGASGLGVAPAGDAKVAGTPYHATGQVQCSMGDAPAASARCDFGVIRGKPGSAEVHVTPPGGVERVLTFRDGTLTGNGGARVRTSRRADLWLVEVNEYEHYRIPDAVINGG